MSSIRVALLHLLLPLLAACAAHHELRPSASQRFRARPPALAPAPSIASPALHAARLDNGLAVLTAESRGAPLVHVELAFAANGGGEPQAPAGVAALAFGWLLEGAAGYDAAALDAAFGGLGASPRLELDPDGIRLGVTVLPKHAEAALALLAQVARHPWLTDAGFERRKAQQLADLAVSKADPWFSAGQAFAASAYTLDHAYGHGPLGAADSLAQIDAQIARNYLHEHLGPKSSALIVTGAIAPAAAAQLVEHHFAGWNNMARRSPAPPPVAPYGYAKIVRVPRPGSPRTLLLVGRPTLRAGDPDEAALDIASYAVGRAWSRDLRQRLGSAAGLGRRASVHFEARRGPGPWLAQADVPAEATAAALSALFETLDSLPLSPLRERQIEAARSSLMARLPARLQSTDALADALADLYLHDRPLARFEQYVAELDDVTASEVHAAAVRYLNPIGLSFVIVADPAVLDAQLPLVRLDRVRFSD